MVKITIEGYPSVSVNWYAGMNAQNALQEAYPQVFFGVNYYGSLGYFVVMLNNTYDAPGSGTYWEFFVNGSPATQGIDFVLLQDGDIISFENTTYIEEIHKGSLLEVKHKHATQ